MDHTGEPSPRVVQIAASDPAMMADCRGMCRNIDAGAEIIDINMDVCQKSCGNRLRVCADAGRSAGWHAFEAVGARGDGAVMLKDAHRLERDNKNGVRESPPSTRTGGIQALSVRTAEHALADRYQGGCRARHGCRNQGEIGIPVFAKRGHRLGPSKAAIGVWREPDAGRPF